MSSYNRDPSAIFDQTPIIDSAYFTKEAYNRVAINQSCVVDVVLMGRGSSNSTVRFYSGPTITPTTLLIQGNQNLVLYPNISLIEGYYIKAEMSGGSSSSSTFAAFCTIYLHED